MKQLLQQLERLLTTRNVWLFVVSNMTIALIIVNENEMLQHTDFLWGRFWTIGLILLVLQTPQLLFTWNKNFIKTKLKRWPYLLFWTGVFALFPIATCILEIVFLQWGEEYLRTRDHYDAEALLVAYVVTFWVALGIEVNAIFHAKSKLIQFVQRIGLDRAFLGIIGFIAVLHGALAASNLEALTQHHRIEADINFVEIFCNFFSFISLTSQFAIAFSCLFFFYYVNRHFLIPKLLKQRGIFYFLAGAIGIIMIVSPILAQLVIWLPINDYLRLEFIPGGTANPFDPANLAVAFVVVAMSTPVILVIEWFQQNHAIVSLQKQKAETELNLLKQQINPHFFFNTLNNLYSLSIQKSMQTPEVILQLSELMRYVIYKGQNETVSIHEEIKYIKDYIRKN